MTIFCWWISPLNYVLYSVSDPTQGHSCIELYVGGVTDKVNATNEKKKSENK